MTAEEKLAEILKIRDLVKEGYAGTLPNGNIVDRREHPEAVPLQANRLLDIPEPKPLPSDDVEVAPFRLLGRQEK